MNTPLYASGVLICDRDGKVLATARDPATAQQIVQMVNAASMI